MVQVFVDPTLSPAGAMSAEQQADGYHHTPDTGICPREEHAQRMRDLDLKRSTMRAPRRGWSLSEYPGQTDHDRRQHSNSNSSNSNNNNNNNNRPAPRHPPSHGGHRQTCIPENAILQVPISRPSAPRVQIPRRPKLPPPRRSYSFTDKEPETPPAHQPGLSPNKHLLDLPSELHYALFDFLDPIDGACLGLAHPRLYAIHRRKNGIVPLSSRYAGPNDLEWAWRGAGPLLRGRVPSHAAADPENKALERLRVKGQVYCRKCGIARCELHRHLREWMGAQYEYCAIRKVYGPRAHESARAYCYMSSPKNPHRCGRHGGTPR